MLENVVLEARICQLESQVVELSMIAAVLTLKLVDRGIITVAEVNAKQDLSSLRARLEEYMT